MKALQDDDNRGTSRSRHTELLRYAVRALNSQGVSQTSLGQIADDLRISLAALYYYVDDLQDLVFQCYRATCERLTAEISAAVRRGGGEIEIIGSFIADALAPASEEFASLSEIGYLRESQREIILGQYDGLLAQLAGVIAKGMSAGRLRTCDPWIAAHTIISMIFWAPISEGWSPAVRAMSPAPNAAALIEIVAQGIKAPGVSPGSIRPVDFSSLFPSSKGLFDKEYLTLARREALLLAASHLFNRKGVDATSLDEIAATVGATKRAVLHYFGDKQGLIEHAYKRAYAIFLMTPRTLAQSELREDEQLASAWFSLSEAYLREDLSPMTPRGGLEALRPGARAEIEAFSAELTREYLAILRQGQESGVLRDFDRGGFLMMVSGAFTWLSRGIFSPASEDYRRIAREISDLLMLGLCNRDG